MTVLKFRHTSENRPNSAGEVSCRTLKRATSSQNFVPDRVVSLASYITRRKLPPGAK